MRDVQPAHLVDVGPVNVEGPEQPEVGLAPRLELEGADRVVDVLEAATSGTLERC